MNNQQYDCGECYAFYLKTGGQYIDCYRRKDYEVLNLNTDGLCARIHLFEMNKKKEEKR